MITRCNCKTVSHDGGPSVGCFVSCLWLGKFGVFKECLGDSQFARRPVIDPLIECEKGV